MNFFSFFKGESTLFFLKFWNRKSEEMYDQEAPRRFLIKYSACIFGNKSYKAHYSCIFDRITSERRTVSARMREPSKKRKVCEERMLLEFSSLTSKKKFLTRRARVFFLISARFFFKDFLCGKRAQLLISGIKVVALLSALPSEDVFY